MVSGSIECWVMVGLYMSAAGSGAQVVTAAVPSDTPGWLSLCRKPVNDCELDEHQSIRVMNDEQCNFAGDMATRTPMSISFSSQSSPQSDGAHTDLGLGLGSPDMHAHTPLGILIRRYGTTREFKADV